MNSVIEDARYLTSFSAASDHRHNCYEIVFLTKGSAKVKVAGRNYNVNAPCLLFFSKLEQHSVQPDSKIYHRYFLCISPTPGTVQDYTLMTVLSNRPDNFCHVLSVAPDDLHEMERLFSSFVNEHKSNLPYHSLKEASLLNELLILIYRRAPQQFSSENSKSISIVWSVQCELEQRCREHFDLQELSDRYHISASYLSHLFKRVTGYAIIQYLTMCRLSLARQLLSETSLPVTEIVFQSGFSDSSNFSRLFRREIGQTPLEYRKHNKIK